MRTGFPVFCSALLLSGAGCCMLPPGDPPNGPIVEPALPAERDRRGAENDAVTSLFAYTLQNCPGAGIAVQGDPAMIPLARRIIERTGKISGIRYAEEAPLVLRATNGADRWNFQLFDTGRKSIVWQEIFILKP
ncbi:hypothetical protein SDC9_209596 [bioreactor metagenome]|uniref:Lipoprotein n=1 Tax=bioreactor metagenome TaxID=1076179 RepID=A0A645JE34_9ZZZZ